MLQTVGKNFGISQSDLVSGACFIVPALCIYQYYKLTAPPFFSLL